MDNRTVLPAQDVINAQKQIIGDLQHQNLLFELTIQKLQSELEQYLPKEPLDE